MKTKSKALLLALCAVLLVVASVFGTLAYLTDTTEVVQNTFTVGQVYIKLDEKNVDGDKSTDDTIPERDIQNDYKLFPGGTYEKDPMVTIEKDSSEAYIRMIVKVSDVDSLKTAFTNEKFNSWFVDEGNYKVFLLQNLVDWDSDAWKYVEYQEKKIAAVTGDDGEVTSPARTEGYYEFRYVGNKCKVVDGTKKDYTIDLSANTALEPLFKNIKIPQELNNADIEKLNNITIDVVAHAIQADGFADAETAWTAFDGQNGLTNGIK